jgi:hypothetical protein
MRIEGSYSRAGDPGRSDRANATAAICLPPARCELHAPRARPAPCGACMRAQQLRLAAHQAASVAAAREWQLAGGVGRVGLAA